jgi:hypothetical protein
MGNLRSKRVKKTPQSGITSDRYEFLGLNQAEPDLGDPLVGPSSITSNPLPPSVTVPYVLVTDTSQQGKRYWLDKTSLLSGGVLQPGSFSVQNNGVRVGSLNIFNDFNFVGTGVTVDAVGLGITVGVATVRISVVDAIAKGNIGDVQYHGSDGLIQGANGFVFNPSNGFVGIGSTLPRQRLDVLGNVSVSGITTTGILSASSATIFNSFSLGNFQIASGITTIRVQNGLVGVGTNNPTATLDVLGTTKLDGVVSVANTVQSTTKDNGALVVEGGVGIERNLNVGESLNVTGISTFNATNVSGSLNVSGVSTFNATNVSGSLNVSGVSTFGGNVSIGTNVDVSNNTNTNTLSINGAEVLSSTRQLKNILSLDNITTATIESAISQSPNTFVDLEIIGISTFLLGPVLIGTATSTGTEDQKLQVDGNSYVSGNLGIGTTNPSQKLHINGDIRLTGTVYDSLNTPGNSGDVLVKTSLGTIEWISQGAVQAGAGGTVTSIQYHNNAGLVDGEPNFVYDFINDRVGIGTTAPQHTLDVYGTLSLSGNSNLIVTDTLDVGVTTSVISTTSPTTIASLNITNFRSARFQIQIEQGTDYQSTDIMSIHNGTTASLVEYGSIATNDYLGSFDVSISGSNMILQVSLNSSSSAKVSVARYALKSML